MKLKMPRLSVELVLVTPWRARGGWGYRAWLVKRPGVSSTVTGDLSFVAGVLSRVAKRGTAPAITPVDSA